MILPEPDPAFRWSREPWGMALRCTPLEAIAQHAFTSRQPRLPDDAAWHAVLASVGGAANQVRRVKQVHGGHVRTIARGQTTEDDMARAIPEGDAVASNQEGLVLAVMVADCVPILVADARSGSAAAIHAGWRGTCARIAQAAIERMVRDWGASAEDLIAAIGPSIGPDDYEVGESLVSEFLKAGHARADVDRWFSRAAPKPHLDLWLANRDQLMASGLAPARIFTAGLSTIRHPDLFDSYRGQGERAGRMTAVVRVPAPGGSKVHVR